MAITLTAQAESDVRAVVRGHETEDEGPRAQSQHLSLSDLLLELRTAAWRFGAQEERTLALQESLLLHPDSCPSSQATAKQALLQGQQIHEALQELGGLARQYGAQSCEVKSAFTAAVQRIGFWRGFARTAEAMLGQVTAEQSRKDQCRKGPRTTVCPSAVEHRIEALAPRARWHLWIDDGSGGLPQEGLSAFQPQGYFVGLLVPEPCPLEPLPAPWQAADQPELGDIDAVIQSLIDAPVGLLGLRIAGLGYTSQELWTRGVREVLHWACRQLPMSGPTQVDVLLTPPETLSRDRVEQEITAGLMPQLASLEPKRFAELTVRTRLLGPHEALLGGYLNALVFTWTEPTPASRARLAATNLTQSCLLRANPRVLRKAWDELCTEHLLKPSVWQKLAGLSENLPAKSPERQVLERVRRRCQSDVHYWQALLESSRARLYQRTDALLEVGQQVAFLQECEPPGTSLEPFLRLAWLTAQVLRSVPKTGAELALEQELSDLQRQLFDEDPRLICQVDLERAVSAIQRFDFAQGLKAMSRWIAVAPCVPGLRLWAKTRRALGQLAGFQGRYAEAARYFNEAIAAFERLSEPALANSERLHSCICQAMATMDDPLATLDWARVCVQRVLSLEPEALRALAKDAEAEGRWKHHLLLRFLVYCGSPSERMTYLEQRAHWQSGQQEPWSLIWLYRAMLLHEAGQDHAAREAIGEAVDLALVHEDSPRVLFTGMVAAMVGELLGLGTSWAPAETEKLRLALPRAPWATVDRVLQKRTAIDAKTFLARTLPFRFH